MRFSNIIGVVCIFGLLCGCAKRYEMRYPPNRWISDSDDTPINRPKAAKRALNIDTQEGYFQQIQQLMSLTEGVMDTAEVIASGGKQRALDTNNFDEVADSTWFKNRIGRFDMTEAEIERFGKLVGPDLSKKLIVSYVNDMTNPPFILASDALGASYAIRFDPPDDKNDLTAYDLISQRVLALAGYNAPSAGMITIGRSSFSIAPDAIIVRGAKDEAKLTKDALVKTFARYDRGKNSKLRAIALRWPDGEIMGPFSFRGTRKDDPNDRIPHEHRRELRALRVFLDFLGRADSNTLFPLDMFISTGGDKGYLKHYVGSTAHLKRSSSKIRVKIAPSPSLDDSLWAFSKADNKNAARGKKWYSPGRWNPQYSNLAFQFLTNSDGFWAAKILMKFNDRILASFVRDAGFSDAAAGKRKLADLIMRRDRTVEYWFSRIATLDNVSLVSAQGGYSLSFDDLFVLTGSPKAVSSTYRYQINDGDRVRLLDWSELGGNELSIPDDVVRRMHSGKIYSVIIETKRPGSQWWKYPFCIFIKKSGSGVSIVGVYR